MQKIFFTLLGAALIAVAWSRPSQALIQSQRAQIGVTIIVNVTPTPIVYVPRTVARVEQAPRLDRLPIVAKFALHARGSAQDVDSTVIDLQNVVAQASAQSALKVQAKVSPNPNATLLTSNYPSATLSGMAGTTVKISCIYQVKVDTAITSWTLRQGLSADFDGSIFPGNGLSNNSYPSPPSSPNPSFTPFVVYPSAWTVLSSGGGMKNYCVDLQVAIPATTPQGTYSSNAIYTLYF
ncbi:MAG TPA: hypothetical protein VJP85_11120 [Candidatus Baltobacteraceae bacterium]|nr:hypothetical protein [Candidatus Baltobacteraceae bacterium]